jgi:hypothetical protein
VVAASEFRTVCTDSKAPGLAGLFSAAGAPALATGAGAVSMEAAAFDVVLLEIFPGLLSARVFVATVAAAGFAVPADQLSLGCALC